MSNHLAYIKVYVLCTPACLVNLTLLQTHTFFNLIFAFQALCQLFLQLLTCFTIKSENNVFHFHTPG